MVNTIIKGIQEKKGSNIVVADLKEIEGAITNYFVICQGNSPTQVEAIAESIGETVRKGLNQWVAMDFVDVIVHVFIPEMRSFYDLEHLWADAKLTHLTDID